MLVWFDQLTTEAFGWSLASHPGIRSLCAGATALIVALLVGPRWIGALRRRRVLDAAEKGDSARLDELSVGKKETPTLGGLILLCATGIAVLLWARLEVRAVSLLALAFAALAGLGLVDDLTKLRTGRRGVSARMKMLWQLLITGCIGVALYLHPLDVMLGGQASSELGTALFVPFTSGGYVALGVFFVPLVMFVATGTSNAVNLTDGLDGLAIGCGIIACATFAVLAIMIGSQPLSEQIGLPHVAGAAEVGVFLSALVGAGIGFLWFNCHPAQIFMGDTGALPLGGVLGVAAILCKQELLLVIVAGVMVAEALSVIVQVGSFKLWRKRVFLIAPLHHHFQFKGLSETQITVRFWIAGAVLALSSLATLRWM